eukprot:6859640-Alexandrium_andersonii.AAC.1
MAPAVHSEVGKLARLRLRSPKLDQSGSATAEGSPEALRGSLELSGALGRLYAAAGYPELSALLSSPELSGALE